MLGAPSHEHRASNVRAAGWLIDGQSGIIPEQLQRIDRVYLAAAIHVPPDQLDPASYLSSRHLYQPPDRRAASGLTRAQTGVEPQGQQGVNGVG